VAAMLQTNNLPYVKFDMKWREILNFIPCIIKTVEHTEKVLNIEILLPLEDIPTSAMVEIASIRFAAIMWCERK
jgi:hypothetical protein